MPNWCSNTITITGDAKEIDSFWTQYEANAESLPDCGPLAAFVPMPEALEGSRSPAPDSPFPNPHWSTSLALGKMDHEHYERLCADQRQAYLDGVRLLQETGYKSWHDWQRANWGIKWGDSETQLDRTTEQALNGYYQTPWGPFDSTFWENVSRQYPGLKFIIVWYEEGMMVEGSMAITNGECVLDDSRDMHSDLFDRAEQALEEVND
jgi:hypothetical protein